MSKTLDSSYLSQARNLNHLKIHFENPNHEISPEKALNLELCRVKFVGIVRLKCYCFTKKHFIIFLPELLKIYLEMSILYLCLFDVKIYVQSVVNNAELVSGYENKYLEVLTGKNLQSKEAFKL